MPLSFVEDFNHGESHSLVQEFMIFANETVAQFLTDHIKQPPLVSARSAQPIIEEGKKEELFNFFKQVEGF